MKQLFAITITATILGVTFAGSYLTSDEFIQEINSKATTWTARKNFEDFTTEELESLAGVKTIYRSGSKRLPKVIHSVNDDEIPDTFDAREAWPECESIGTIRYQGKCGSCWAFAAVEVMSDRLCIATKGDKKFVFSPEELLSCCTACGNGCKGGVLDEPFKYWVSKGIPSGGDEGSDFGCKPYTAANTSETPACTQGCVSNFNRTWSEDARHGIKAYEVKNSVEQMQYEIMTNGPIVSYMLLYQDFYNFGSGIYKYTTGSPVGGHAVKIIGWGTEKDVPYWLVANSWGTNFGDHGFFRILRGSNDCQIERTVTSGSPNIDE